jgi:hypothetical protein
MVRKISVFAVKAYLGQPVGAGLFAGAAVVRVGSIVALRAL